MADIEVRELSSEKNWLDTLTLWVDRFFSLGIVAGTIGLLLGGIAFSYITFVLANNRQAIDVEIIITATIAFVCFAVLYIAISQKWIYSTLERDPKKPYEVAIIYFLGRLVRTIGINRIQVSLGLIREIKPLIIERFKFRLTYARVTASDGTAYRGFMDVTVALDLKNPSIAVLAAGELNPEVAQDVIIGTIDTNNADVFAEKTPDQIEAGGIGQNVIMGHVEKLLPGRSPDEYKQIALALKTASISIALTKLGFKIASLSAFFLRQDDIAEAAELADKAGLYLKAANKLRKSDKNLTAKEAMDMVFLIANITQKQILDITGSKDNLKTAAYSNVATSKKI